MFSITFWRNSPAYPKAQLLRTNRGHILVGTRSNDVIVSTVTVLGVPVLPWELNLRFWQDSYSLDSSLSCTGYGMTTLAVIGLCVHYVNISNLQVWCYFRARYTSPRPARKIPSSSPSRMRSGGPLWPWPPWAMVTWRMKYSFSLTMHLGSFCLWHRSTAFTDSPTFYLLIEQLLHFSSRVLAAGLFEEKILCFKKPGWRRETFGPGLFPFHIPWLSLCQCGGLPSRCCMLLPTPTVPLLS